MESKPKSDLQNEVNQLRKQIDLLTSEAFELMNQGHYLDSDRRLKQRFKLLEQLASLAQAEVDKTALQHYFSALYQRDQTIIQQLQHDGAELKMILANLQKIKEYTQT